MKKYFFFVLTVFLLSTLCVTGCNKKPTVCDNITGESYLCKIAGKTGITIEDVGNSLIIFNAVAINQGMYTKDQAKSALTRLRTGLDEGITYTIFKKKFMKYAEDYPGLLDVLKIYVDEFEQNIPITRTDKEILNTWLTNRIKSLE